MTDLTPHIPEVVSEIRELFERYEKALVDKNVDVLDATFWNSPSRSKSKVGRRKSEVKSPRCCAILGRTRQR